jgi:hypothetical protein
VSELFQPTFAGDCLPPPGTQSAGSLPATSHGRSAQVVEISSLLVDQWSP